MSIFTPGRRWQPPFYPFKKETFGRRLLAGTERLVKGPLFGCRMCGNCLLQETAFVCPMECPKGLRNGPCGGSTPETCYVDESRKCIWYIIYDRSLKMKRDNRLMEVLPPLDWDKTGTETWGEVARQIRRSGTAKFIKSRFSRRKPESKEIWESVFRPIRQPEWWRGDSDYHVPGYHDPVSDLEKKFRSGEFVFTSEIIPPLHSDSIRLSKNIELVRQHVAAINFTDNSSSISRMSGFACCSIAARAGTEPVLQLTARDNNRYGFQSKVIGANAMGIKNILCISGDSPRRGPKPMGSLEILDFDSVQMIWLLRKMRDEGKYLDGREIKYPPQIFIGAAASPLASRPDFQAMREHKKVNAGAQFLQTNLMFDADRFSDWLGNLDKRNILGKVFVLVGVAPLRSKKMAMYLQNEIPGVIIPDKIIRRLEKAGDRAKEEGIAIALEFIDTIKNFRGVSGVHLMTLGCEESVERIVRESRIVLPGKS
jgi:methylenetetrahydrofolate reductase (NADPH)